MFYVKLMKIKWKYKINDMFGDWWFIYLLRVYWVFFNIERICMNCMYMFDYKVYNSF